MNERDKEMEEVKITVEDNLPIRPALLVAVTVGGYTVKSHIAKDAEPKDVVDSLRDIASMIKHRFNVEG